MQMSADRIRERLAALGKTAHRASVEAGLGEDGIRNILRGLSTNVRTDTAIKLAGALECSVAYLMGQVEDSGGGSDGVHSEQVQHIEWLPVRHEVGAGYFMLLDKELPAGEFGPVAANPRYATTDQWLERVIGPGGGSKFTVGVLAHIVAVAGYVPRIGDYVVVRRAMNGMIERSIRIVEANGVGMRLSALGPDGEEVDKAPHYPDKSGDVEIVGRVIGKYEPLD